MNKDLYNLADRKLHRLLKTHP